MDTNVSTRREALQLFGRGVAGIALGAVVDACSSRSKRPVIGLGSDKQYLSPDELADTIQKEYGICVGVGDPSTTGPSFWDSDIKPAIQNAAIRDYYRRCGETPSPHALYAFGKGIRVAWLSGRSFDRKGEEKGPAAIAFEDHHFSNGDVIGILERYGTTYQNKTELYRGKPIE